MWALVLNPSPSCPAANSRSTAGRRPVDNGCYDKRWEEAGSQLWVGLQLSLLFSSEARIDISGYDKMVSMFGNSDHPVKELVRDYKVASDEIALFVDESGDSQLKDPNNKVFILAACVTLGASMNQVADEWSYVREALCDDRNKQLHFKDLRRRLQNSRRQKKLCDFFDKADVGRIAVAMTEAQGVDLTSFHGGLVIRATFDELLFQQAKLIGCNYTKLVIMFEDSPIMRRVYELCKNLSLKKGDDLLIPLNFHWITKDINAPWMEMADGIAHTWAGKVREGSSGQRFDNRYRAIFAPSSGAPAVSRKLTSTFSQPEANSIAMNVAEAP